MKNDYFEHKADKYEQDNNRTNNVGNIATTVLSNVNFDKNMEIMDFGSGTGLLLEKVAPFVKKITAIDISKSMNKTLSEKRDKLACELEIIELDLTKTKLDKKFDAIISSMTLHHVLDIQSLFNDFYVMLNENGVIAISDLDTENGSFHTEDTGIFHFGFDRNLFANTAKTAGFKNVKVTNASIVKKPHGEYSVFLLTGEK